MIHSPQQEDAPGRDSSMHTFRLLATAGLVALLTPTAPAGAQNEAPFAIRRPPDGATVREKVRVEVPMASIPEGGYVAYSIDGQFRVALAPTEEQRAKMKTGQAFVWIWDTKAPVKLRGGVVEEVPQDGEHEVTAT